MYDSLIYQEGVILSLGVYAELMVSFADSFQLYHSKTHNMQGQISISLHLLKHIIRDTTQYISENFCVQLR